jgi:hypothetical protein
MALTLHMSRDLRVMRPEPFAASAAERAKPHRDNTGLDRQQRARIHGLPKAITSNAMIDRLREAADALNAGDPTPLVALMDDDVDWRGVSRGVLWWKQTPS